MATHLTPDQMKQFVREHFEDFVNKRNAAASFWRRTFETNTSLCRTRACATSRPPGVRRSRTMPRFSKQVLSAGTYHLADGRKVTYSQADVVHLARRLRQMVAAGWLGRKSGRGLYNYQAGERPPR